MRGFAFLVIAIGFAASAPQAQAQVGVAVGVAPDCPYGYYDVAPYNCAPYGYYGPEWFTGGVFIGVGPWFHGAADFRGHVNNHYHPEHGYEGPMPARGERPIRRSMSMLRISKAMKCGMGAGHMVKK